MWVDQIVEQIRGARREYSAQFGFDLHAMAADLHKREQDHVARVVSLPPKPAKRRKTA